MVALTYDERSGNILEKRRLRDESTRSESSRLLCCPIEFNLRMFAKYTRAVTSRILIRVMPLSISLEATFVNYRITFVRKVISKEIDRYSYAIYLYTIDCNKLPTIRVTQYVRM